MAHPDMSPAQMEDVSNVTRVHDIIDAWNAAARDAFEPPQLSSVGWRSVR